jgi:hypothetical protein
MDSNFPSDQPFIVHIPLSDHDSYFLILVDEEALEFDDDLPTPLLSSLGRVIPFEVRLSHHT